MKTEFKVGDRVPKRWKLYQHDDGIRVHEVDQSIIPYVGNPPRFIAEVVEVERPKQKVKLYPALLKWRDGFTMSHELFKDEFSAKSFFPSKFIRLLTDDHHAVEVEI